LLEVDQLVSGLVVELGPAAISLSCRNRLDHHPIPQFLGSVQERANLGEASHRELAVVVPGETVEQGDALQPEQVRQRVHVDHRRLGSWL